MALTDIATGETVVKYGESIGEATEPISRGVLTHVNNIRGTRA